LLSQSSVIPALRGPQLNHLLAALPAAEYDRLAPELELVPMPLGEVLYVMEDGASAEIAIVSNEGILWLLSDLPVR
jgi:hypothetical protein